MLKFSKHEALMLNDMNRDILFFLERNLKEKSGLLQVV